MNNLVKLVSNHLKLNKSLENLIIGQDLITELKQINLSKYEFTSGCYNRNRIHTTDSFEILLLNWDIDSKTPLHEHPENGCKMLLLEGCLKEKIVNENMTLYNKLRPGEQSYIDNNLGKHVIMATKNQDLLYIVPHFYN